jgi:processive rubber oxygenase RoxA-like protein
MSSLHSNTRIRIHRAARKVVRPRVILSALFLLVVVTALFVVLQEGVWDYRDSSPARGAFITRDTPTDSHTSVRYLDQGWSPGESSWFYTVTQGSDLVPYSLALSLTSAGSDRPFLSLENVERWRYLPQGSSPRNPDALPVGFARDEYQGRAYLGFTCAACHTTQVNYDGVALRIDGGPSLADFQTFLNDLAAALKATAQVDATGRCAADVCKSFVARVLARGDYDDELAVTRDLIATLRRVDLDREANESGVAYGYGRLDAFGRIFNRVLSRVLTPESLEDMLPDAFSAEQLAVVLPALKPVLQSPDQDDLVERALAALPEPHRQQLVQHLFNPSSAPVSYPFLWDIPQHDYVQWNGIVANAAFGAIGRNAGEVIGVFGTLDWKIKDGSSFAAMLGGQGLRRRHISYESSIYVHNLRRIEAQIVNLTSPVWPEDVLGTIDRERALRGRVLFAERCAQCHASIDRDAADRRIVASMTRLDDIATDRTMAENSLNYSGYSGMLRNQYVNVTGVGNILIDRTAPVAALLTKATRGVIAEPYPSANVVRRVVDWLNDLIEDYISNEIQPSLKSGNYEPDTTANPFASLLAYKGRALNGIWATAPYLHNGSVPTLYDLLLPKRSAGDPEGEEYRPDDFLVGSRELDPVKVGFISQGYDGGSRLDTALPGNGNAGHEYGTIHDPEVRSGKYPALTREQRLELVEFMKAQ